MNAIKISKELKQAVDTLIAAQAIERTIRPVVQSIQQEWIEKNNPQIAEEWKESGVQSEIYTIDRLWLMDEDLFNAYAKETAVEKRKAGFEFNDDECPLLVAQHNVLKAEWAVIKESVCLHGKEGLNPTNIELRKKLIDLCVGAVVNAPKSAFV